MFDSRGTDKSREKEVYSPKISPDLIPDLYRIAKAKKIPMTKLVSTIIADAIRNIRIEVQTVKKEVEKEVYVLTGDKP